MVNWNSKPLVKTAIHFPVPHYLLPLPLLSLEINQLANQEVNWLQELFWPIKTSNLTEIPYLGPPDPHRPAPDWGSGLIWQDFLAPVQHFVRQKMTIIHLETTSPPEVVSRCKIAQINQEIPLYKYTWGIFLEHTDNHFKEYGTL
jgi:hypothetical protein